jgi:hypothetical protein
MIVSIGNDYQNPPVDREIHCTRKKQFFELLGKVTSH